MFNPAFVQFNIVAFTRYELDIAWNGKDKFQEDFKIELYLISFKFNSWKSFFCLNSIFGAIKDPLFFSW
jgi:C2 domain of PTEN tumour-suppressor protein